MLGPVFGQRCRIFLRMQYRLQEGRRRVVLTENSSVRSDNAADRQLVTMKV